MTQEQEHCSDVCSGGREIRETTVRNWSDSQLPHGSGLLTKTLTAILLSGTCWRTLWKVLSTSSCSTAITGGSPWISVSLTKFLQARAMLKLESLVASGKPCDVNAVKREITKIVRKKAHRRHYKPLPSCQCGPCWNPVLGVIYGLSSLLVLIFAQTFFILGSLAFLLAQKSHF